MVWDFSFFFSLLNGASQKYLGFVSDYFEINLLQEI